jgi:Fe-S cluster assembly protein SufD
MPVSAALRAFEAQWLAREAPGEVNSLSRLRESAMRRLLRLGLPTTRDETWRYTNLKHLTSHGFMDAPQRGRGEFEPQASLSLLGVGERASTVLMVNGHPALSPYIDDCFNGIEISSLRSLSRIDPSLIATRILPLSDADQARWGLLNTALFSDGLYLKVTAQVTTPLVILHVLTADGPHNIAHPRVIIDAEPGSRAIIIEHFVEQGAQPRVRDRRRGRAHRFAHHPPGREQPRQAVHHRVGRRSRQNHARGGPQPARGLARDLIAAGRA